MPSKNAAIPLDTAPRTQADGTVVAVGQVWQDLDPRVGDRRCRVMGFLEDKVLLERYPQRGSARLPPTKVALKRLRPVSGGWRLVPPASSSAPSESI